MHLNRTTVPAILLGLVLLAAVACYSIFLPKAEGDDTGGSSAFPTLPDSLPMGLKAVDLRPATPGATVSNKQYEASAAEQASKVYGVPAQVRVYSSGTSASTGTTQQTGQISAQIVAIDTPPGDAFAADAAQPAASLLKEARTQQVLSSLDGAVCVTYYQQPLPAGATAPAGELPEGVRCQLTGGDSTWLINASGLTAADSVSILKSAAGR